MYGNTVLIFAAYCGHIEIVKLLLEKGADIDAINNYGKTALMLTLCPEIKKILIEAGAK
jgi:ankyrin repeat protein